MFNKKSAIQKEELRFLISSIKSLENCIQPFLDECDKDNNDLITDKEWGTCLDLSDGKLCLENLILANFIFLFINNFRWLGIA